MCATDPGQPESLVRQTVGDTGIAAVPSPRSTGGSRRRRIWELDGHAHCPVLGVCLPMQVLRKLIDKALGGKAVADDYALHCGAVADCKYRSAVAEAVQRDLDQRYAMAVRQAGKAKTTEALAAWWITALQAHDIAGPLWATLTHPRCTLELAHRVGGQVHMLQHQVGMAARVDVERFDALLDENAVLTRALAGAQQRCTRQAEQHTQRVDALQRTTMQLRAELVARDSCIAALNHDLLGLEAAVPGLKSRVELARDVERLMDRHHEQQRLLLQAQQESERHRRRVAALTAELQQQRAAMAQQPSAACTATVDVVRLGDQAVLCVGGRQASVPVYRHLIENTGARFLHHDGGEEDSESKLDATLAAADLVICQTGCVSHNAYWRVKDHCKRTGKRCVFVESPSNAGIKRALLSLAPTSDPSPPAA